MFMMGEGAEEVRLQSYLEGGVKRRGECDHEPDGGIATLVDDLGVLPSRYAAMHRVVDVTQDASHATPRCTAANHVIRRYASAVTSDWARTTWLDLGRERHEIS